MQTLPRKIMEQCRLRPAKSWSNADFAREIREPLFFAPQNHGDFVLWPTKLWSNADFAPQNGWDIVSVAKKCNKILVSSQFFNFFCKSLSFLRLLQPFGPLFKENMFCVTVPLRAESSKPCIMTLSLKQTAKASNNCPWVGTWIPAKMIEA